MSTASTSGLGRKKKAPGVMDQITKFLSGGDKKKRSKVSIYPTVYGFETFIIWMIQVLNLHIKGWFKLFKPLPRGWFRLLNLYLT